MRVLLILLLLNSILGCSKAKNGTLPEGRDVLELVNNVRAQGRNCGSQDFEAAQSLQLNEKLERAARQHSEDLSRNQAFSHTGTNGSSVSDRVEQQNYSWSDIGENIAQGQRTAREVVSSWLQSDGHCKNIMNPSFTELGIYRTEDIWVLVLASPL